MMGHLSALFYSLWCLLRNAKLFVQKNVSSGLDKLSLVTRMLVTSVCHALEDLETHFSSVCVVHRCTVVG